MQGPCEDSTMPVCSGFHSFLFNTLSSHNHSCSLHPENPVSFSWPPEDYNFKHHLLIGCSSSEYWTMQIKLQKEKHGSKPEQEKIQTSSRKMRHERERGLKKDTTFYVLWPGQLGTSLSGDLGEMVKSFQFAPWGLRKPSIYSPIPNGYYWELILGHSYAPLALSTCQK